MLEALDVQAGQTIVDGTFGAGGYSRAILDTAPGVEVLALDRDETAIRDAAALVTAYDGRLTVVLATFGSLEAIAREHLPAAPDAVVLDIGVSSMQLDTAERGFSFMADGPLDMRMGGEGPTAADFVNSADEADIADVIFQLGEERRSRAIAKAIVRAREAAPIGTTLELARIVEKTLGRARGDEKHPATRTFQALRIHINDELGELAAGLAAAENILRPGGRLVVVTFHSLEDRVVKRFFAERSGKQTHGSRHLPAQSIKSSPPSFRIVNARPLTPSKGELDVNPRSRSARLRAGVRTEAPAWPLDRDALGVPDPGA